MSFIRTTIKLTQLAMALLVVSVLCTGINTVSAEPNQQINYQGKLTDGSGVAVPDGTYNMRFWLLQSTSQATTSAVWTESLTGADQVQVTNGLFSVMLGSTSPLTSVDFNQTLYLGVEIGGTGSPAWDGEMSPRKPLGTVPAAFESLKLGGVASSSFLRSDQADTMSASSASTLLTITQSGAGDILNLFDGGSEVFTVLDGGNVGIGTTSPTFPLDVVGSGQVFRASQNNGSGQAVFTLDRFNHSTQNNSWGYNISNGGGSLANGSLAISPQSPGVTADLGFSGAVAGASSGSQFVIKGATGNIGIGTTSPYAKLSVAGSVVADRLIATSTTGTSTISHNLAFRNGEYISNNTDGHIRIQGAGAPVNDNYLDIDLGHTWQYGVTLGAVGGSNILRYNSPVMVANDAPLRFGDQSTAQFVYSTAGGLGLHALNLETNVSGVSNNSGYIFLSESGDGRVPTVATDNPTLRIYSDDAAQADDYLELYHDQTNANFVWGNGNLIFNGSGATVFGGNVGIGSSSPYAKLTLDHQVSDAKDVMRVDVFDGLGTTTKFIVDTNGNVGIGGTTSPMVELSVEGGLALMGGFYDNSASSGLSGMVLQTTGTGVQWVATSTLGIDGSADDLTDNSIEELSDVAAMTENYGDLFYWNGTAWADIATSSLGLGNGTFLGLSDTPGSFTSNAIPYVSGSALAFDSTFVYDGTNLGLGTASPGAMLDIFGAGNGLRLSYDGSNYAELSVDSSGILSLTSTGGTGSGYTLGSGLAEDTFTLFDGNALDFYFGLDDSDDTFKLGTGSTVGANVIGAFTSTTSTFNTAIVASTTATSTFTNGIALSGGCFRTADGNCLQSAGDTSVVVAAADSPAAEKAYADYVADGTNDEVEIQQAIDYVYANGGGGTVYLLAGNFEVSTSTAPGIAINMATSTQLVGQGAATVLKLKDGNDDGSVTVIVNAQNTPGVTISNFKINANQDNQSWSQVAVYLGGASSSTVSNMEIVEASQYAVSVESSVDVSIVNNLLRDSNTGVRAYSSDHALIQNNNLRQIDNVALYLEDVTYSNISNNTVVGTSVAGGYSGGGISVIEQSMYNNISQNNLSNLAGGIKFDAPYSYAPSHNTISHNTIVNIFSDNEGDLDGIGIDLRYDSSNNTISDNNIENIGDYGIGLLGNGASTNSVISGNYIYKAGLSGTVPAVFVDSNSNTSIIANSIYSTSTYAMIEISSNASSTLLANNHFDNPNSTNYVADAGTDTRYNEWDRTTITTDNARGYNLFSIIGSTTATSAAITQLGTGDIFTLNNAGGRVFTVNNSGDIGVGTSSPNSRLTIQGAAGGASTLRIASSTGKTTLEMLANGNLELPGQLISAGIEWTARTAAGDNDSWNSVAYGNGRYVAVGGSGDRVMTSPDGINWATTTAAGDNDQWSSIAYGNGLFVAVGNSGDRVMTSPDGIIWTARSAAGDNDDWQSVTYGNGLFVAIASYNFGSSDNVVMTSPDGITWTARSAAGDNDDWYEVAYGNGTFVAVGTGTGLDRVMTSPDGITWTVRSAAGNNDLWQSVTYGNGLFVAVGGGGSGDHVATSPDGITWTARSAAGNNDYWYTVTYGNGLFVAGGAVTGDRVMTSPDGITWTVRSAAGNNDNWSSVTYANGKFVAVGGSGDRVMTSGFTTENHFAHNNVYLGGTSFFGGLQVGTTTSTVASVFFQGEAGKTPFAISSSTGARLLTLTQSGNLGVGTDTPNYKLTIAGDTNVTSATDLVGYRINGAPAMTGSTTLNNFYMAGASSTSFTNAATYNYALGGNALTYLTTGDNNFAVGKNALRGSTTVGTSGSNNTAIGEDTLLLNTTGSYNNVLGFWALNKNTTGSNNNAFGKYALWANTTGGDNNAFGDSALLANTTGTFNNAFGDSALTANISGSHNNALGQLSLSTNTTGSYNTAIGSSALLFNTSGTGNLALGNSSLYLNSTGSYNTALGYFAGRSSSIGWDNISIGRSALYANTTGSYNTAIGYQALDSNIGTGTIAIGYNAAENATGVDRGIFIGYDIDAFSTTEDDVLNIGNLIFGNNVDGTGTTISSGNIGIGTSSPSARFSIQNTAFSGNGVVGLDQYLDTQNSVLSAVQYGNRFYLNASNTATTTIVGSVYRLKDDTTFGNTLRGLEVQANKGVNTKGENTALSGFARTFGVRGYTSADAGASFEPAGGYFETGGTTQGNAVRGYSSTITTATLLSLFQDSSTFAGTGLEMNFGNTTGSFSSTTSKYLDFQNAGVSVFTVSAFGTTTIGDGTTNNQAGLQIGYGGICVDNDGSCNASTTGRITAVESLTGNSDLAEMYFSSTDLEPGEVVVLKGGLSIDRAEKDSKTPILGVVSTKPGLTLGFDDESLNEGENGYPLALSGRVPVKLSTENGPIMKGDQLMLSSLPGIAMKATGTGATIGIALEDFDDSRQYSDTFINQFGDDMVDPVYEPVFTNADPRINDGCYYSGGRAAGEAPCVPLKATTTAAQITEANQMIEEESVEEALEELAEEKSDIKYLADGTAVKVGRVVMFVDLGYRWMNENQLASIGVLMGTSSIANIGENENETIFERLVALANRFVDGVLSVLTLKADRVETSELCVDGVCVTADDLRTLLNTATDEEVSSNGVIDEVDDVNEENDNSGSDNDGPVPEVIIPPVDNSSTTATTTEEIASTSTEPVPEVEVETGTSTDEAVVEIEEEVEEVPEVIEEEVIDEVEEVVEESPQVDEEEESEPEPQEEVIEQEVVLSDEEVN